MTKKIIFSDFDGTLTENDQMTPEFFQILDLIEKNNHELIIVSGRSVSWGHFFLTHFPCRTAIMENGASISTYGQDGFFRDLVLASGDELEQLMQIALRLTEEVNNLPLTTDSFGRLCDRAIELGPLKANPELKDQITKIITSMGGSYSISNVHLNFWVGEINKAKGVDFYREHLNESVDVQNSLYFGDAANDESLFKYFPQSVGVSNIEDVLDQLEHKPSIVLKGKENRGPSGVLNYLTDYFSK